LSPPSSSTQAPDGEQLLRFDVIERTAHWLTALCFLTLIFTGAALYIPAVISLIGRRALVERIHVDVGLALMLPLIVSLAGSWGKGLRADLSRINRWNAGDRQWLRLTLRRQPTGGVPVGKFNAGQKLNGAITAGVMLVMLGTGSVMHWPYYWPLSWRTGATFTHEVISLVFVVVVVGHIGMALTHPPALRSMFTGRVSRAWARHHAPAWLEDLEQGTQQKDQPSLTG
jgi:formate dehydrogenase subunit gamma